MSMVYTDIKHPQGVNQVITLEACFAKLLDHCSLRLLLIPLYEVHLNRPSVRFLSVLSHSYPNPQTADWARVTMPPRRFQFVKISGNKVKALIIPNPIDINKDKGNFWKFI